MELRWLEAFISVAEELHFGRAAERLHLAQSPLSQTIRKLEKELGTPLFERNTRSVSLTAAGNALLPHARGAIAEVDLSRRASRSAIGGTYGNATIGFSGALNHLTLPPAGRAVRSRYPDVTLALVDRVVTTEAVQQLQHGTLDLAELGVDVVAVDTVPERAGFSRTFGAKDSWVVDPAAAFPSPAQAEALGDFTAGSGPSLVIEATGMPGSLDNALAMVATAGRVVTVGISDKVAAPCGRGPSRRLTSSAAATR